MTVNVETSPFAMFPAQATYDNHDWEKRKALQALSLHAPDADSLREVAIMLELIDPPEPAEDEASPEPVLCPRGHDQADHGRTRSDGRRYCRTCAHEPANQRGNMNAAGTRRRIRHLLLNGFSQRELGGALDVSAQTISRISTGQMVRVAPARAQAVREFFDQHRDEFRTTRWDARTAAVRRDWVWAELYEDLDDPACRPVVPKRVAA